MLSILKQIIKNLSEEHSDFFWRTSLLHPKCQKKKRKGGANASTANSASTIGFDPRDQH
jgi:hypothetical protein